MKMRESILDLFKIAPEELPGGVFNPKPVACSLILFSFVYIVPTVKLFMQKVYESYA